MQSRSIEDVLIEQFGADQYQAMRHASQNRTEIEASDTCRCFACLTTFEPKEILKWSEGNQTACCPNCGTSDTVIGSASGLPMADEFLKLVGAHWLR